MLARLDDIAGINNKNTLNISVDTDILNYNPMRVSDHTSALINRLVYDTLFYACGFIEKSNLTLDYWTYNKDLLKYTFSLKENYWSSGERVTAYDYYYGLKEILRPQNGYSVSFHLFDIVNAFEFSNSVIQNFEEVGISIIDSTKFEITLCSHVEFFPKILSMVNLIPVKTSYYLANNDINMVDMGSNGPFYVKKHVLGEYIILQKNKYYTGRVNDNIDNIIFHVIDSYDKQTKLFKLGILDITCTTLFEYQDINKYKHTKQFFSNDLVTLVALSFNKNKPLYYNRVFKGIIYNIINKEEINRVLHYGLNICNSFIPHGMSYSHKINDITCNKISDEDKIAFINKYPTIRVAYSKYYPNKMIVDCVADQLHEKLKINVKLIEVDFDNIVNDELDNDYDICLRLLTMNFDDPIDPFLSFLDEDLIYEEEVNELEELIEEINVSTGTRLIELYNKLNNFIGNQMPVIPLFSLKNYYLYNGKFKNVTVDKFGCYQLV